MKRILLILSTLISLGSAAIAQTNECGTPDISETDYMALPWYGDEDDSFLTDFYDSLEAAMNNPNPLARGVVEDVWYRIPIQFWIYRVNSTTPGGATRLPNEEDIQRLMDAANKACRDNGIKVQLYLDCYEFVNNANGITVDGYSDENNLVLANRRTGAINVHIVDDVVGASGKFNSLYNAIFIQRDVSFNDVSATTFPHELGHYFGLLHTHQFSGWFCLREPVTRGYKLTACPNVPGYNKRCKWTGDLLCDTPADPEMSYESLDNCVYTLGEKDHYDDTFVPDEHNYMAYGNHGCRNNFSAGQIKWMYWWLVHVQRPLSSGSTWSTINNNTAFDIYEPDNNDITAREITIGEVQEHTFYDAAGGVCEDNKDWLRFKYPATGTNYDLQLQIHNGSSVGEVKVYLRNVSNGTVGPQLTSLSETVVSGVRLITLTCTSLTPGNEYLIEILRDQSNIGSYEVGLKELGIPPTITGSDFICSTNTTFTLSNPPIGTTITWAATPSNRFATTAGASQSGSGTTAVVRSAYPSSSGEGTITFYIQGSCGTVPVKKESIWVDSPPLASGITFGIPSSMHVNETVNITVDYPPIGNRCDLEDAQWDIYGAIVLPGGVPCNTNNNTNKQIYFNQSADPIVVVKAKVKNVCGWSDWSLPGIIHVTGGSFRYAVYPNPSSETLIIESTHESLANKNEGFTINSNETRNTHSYRIYDFNRNTVVLEGDLSSKTEIEVSTLSKGRYILIIWSAKGEEETHHIIID